MKLGFKNNPGKNKTRIKNEETMEMGSEKLYRVKE